MKPSVDELEVLDIRNYPDVNGNLGFLEGGRDVPFSIRRLFYVFGVHPGDVRGQHAHKRCKQFLVCVNGSVKVTCDDGRAKRVFDLDSPLKGLYIPPMIWAEQRYASNDTMLFVLADQLFGEADYVREYEDFLRERKAKR